MNTGKRSSIKEIATVVGICGIGFFAGLIVLVESLFIRGWRLIVSE